VPVLSNACSWYEYHWNCSLHLAECIASWLQRQSVNAVRGSNRSLLWDHEQNSSCALCEKGEEFGNTKEGDTLQYITLHYIAVTAVCTIIFTIAVTYGAMNAEWLKEFRCTEWRNFLISSEINGAVLFTQDCTFAEGYSHFTVSVKHGGNYTYRHIWHHS